MIRKMINKGAKLITEKETEMSNAIAGAGVGTSLKAMLGVNKPVVLMDKQVVFHPQDTDADSIKAKVSIEKNYNGATLKAGLAFNSDSLLGALLHEFTGQFSIKVEKEEEIKDALLTLDGFHKFVSVFVEFTKKALDMYPEMAKKEEKTEDTGFAKMKAMIGGSSLYGSPRRDIMAKVNEVEQKTGMKATTIHLPRSMHNLFLAEPRGEGFYEDIKTNKRLFEFDVVLNAEELSVDVGDEPIVKTKVSEEE